MAKPNLIRDLHKVRLLDRIRRHGSTSRARLAQELGLTRSTVTNLVNELSSEGYVRDGGRRIVRHETGRPGVELMLNADGAYFIGAEIGYQVLRVVVLDLAGDVLGSAQEGFSVADQPTKVLSQLARMIKAAGDEYGGDWSRTKGVGVAVTGTTVGGAIALSPVLSWRNVEVREPLEAAIGCPIIVENNANAAALAEVYSRDDARENLVYVHLDRGIGAGILANGEIYRGTYGAAGEIGNMRLTPDGPADTKGNIGTFEAMAALGSLLRSYEELGGGAVELDGLIADFEAGSPAARTAVNEWTTWVGQGILVIMNVLSPEEIVLGGRLSALARIALPTLQAQVRSEQLPGNSDLQLSVSSLGTAANALGGAMLVYDSLASAVALDGLARAERVGNWLMARGSN